MDAPDLPDVDVGGAVPLASLPAAPMESASASNGVKLSERETPNEPTRSAFQTTLNVASTAANLVLFPYVVAGRAAYQATTFAVTAPMKVTKHVANSLSESWHQPSTTQAPPVPSVDLFGERELACSLSVETVSSNETDSEESMSDTDTPVVEGVLFEAEASVESEVVAAETPTYPPPPVATPGVVSQLIFLPVRFVSSSVSTAATLPASAISFGGRTISGAVATSQSLASSALVASGGLALRTSRHVASGLTHGAFTTAHHVSGLVGSSVRTASDVIPPSVSTALWHGMARTGSMSTSVISYAIAVPTYRMAQALVPQVEELFTEQQLVDTTKDGVKMLVKLLGPQNAFYVLKFIYETVNSEEVYDAFLLCQDLVRESLDADNYKKAGTSVSEATGLETLKPVVKSLYEMMPSLDELVDAALFVGEIADEIMTQAVTTPINDDSAIEETGRFEILSSEEEDDKLDIELVESITPPLPVVRLSPVSAVFADESFEVSDETDDVDSPQQVTTGSIDAESFGAGVVSFEDTSDEEEDLILVGKVDTQAFGSGFAMDSEPKSSSPYSSAHEDPFAEFFNSSVSFFSSVLDSDEASMLMNTFGDFIDVLVE